MFRRRDRSKYSPKRQRRYTRKPGKILNRHRSLEISVEPDEESTGSSTGIGVVKGRMWGRFGPKGRFLTVAFLIGMGITISKIYYDRGQVEAFYSLDRESMSQIKVGKNLYQANCAFCHGDRLEGKPGWNQKYVKGKRPAPPLSSRGNAPELSDRELFDIIKFGGQPFSPVGYTNDMPGFEMLLSDGEIWATLAFIRFHSQKD